MSGSRHRAPLILSPTPNMMRHEMDEATRKKKIVEVKQAFMGALIDIWWKVITEENALWLVSIGK